MIEESKKTEESCKSEKKERLNDIEVELLGKKTFDFGTKDAKVEM